MTQPPITLDDMDIADIEIVTFDWSSRVTDPLDPIVAATVVATPTTLAVGNVVLFGAMVQVKIGPATALDTSELLCTVQFKSNRSLHWPAVIFATNL